jgi:amphi-Trp domain-containing protein
MGEDKEFKHIEDTESKDRNGGHGRFPKLKVKHEAENLKFQMALDYLQQILDIARDGNFLVEADGESVNLTPAKAVDLEVRAKDADGRQSLSFELTWDKEPGRLEQAEESLEGNIQGDMCVANRVRTMEDEASRDDDLERRFERDFFGGCGCVEIPSQ